MRLGRLNPSTTLDTTVSDAPKTWNRQQRAPAGDEVLLDDVEEQRSHAIERKTGGKLPRDENGDENHDKRQEKLHDLRYLHGSISNFSHGVGLRHAHLHESHYSRQDRQDMRRVGKPQRDMPGGIENCEPVEVDVLTPPGSLNKKNSNW